MPLIEQYYKQSGPPKSIFYLPSSSCSKPEHGPVLFDSVQLLE